MLTVTLKSKPYNFPTSWEEFTPDQGAAFVRMASCMDDFESGRIDFEAFTVGITLAQLGVEKVSAFTDEFAENVWRLKELLAFPYKITTAADGRRIANLTVKLSENLLPQIRDTKGYAFRREPSGRMDCSLTAEQYIDALELMQAYQNTRHPSALESLVLTLYPGIQHASAEESIAVYYNFRGILAWIRSIPSYALIFPPSDGAEREVSGHNPVGLASSIFSLAKAGYGDINTVKDLPLFSYLGLLMQQSIESIHTLSASGMKPTQIADRLNLPIDIVLQYTVSKN